MSAHLDRALLLSERGRHSEAVREFVAHVAEDPDNGYSHGLLALALAEIGDFGGASLHAEKSLRQLPDQGFPLFVMSQLARKRNDLALAADWIDKAIELEPEKTHYWQLLASIRALQDRASDAMVAIDRCLELDPENVECLNLRASIMVMRGNQRAAAEIAREVLRLNPENSIAHINQSWWMMSREAYGSAMNSIEEGLRLDPESDAGRVALIQALKLQNPSITMLVGLHYFASKIAPLLLAIVAWIYYWSLKSLDQWPPVSTIEYVLAWGVYGAFLAIVFACPVSDVIVLLFRRGRNAVSREARVVSLQLSCIAICYWLVFTAVMYFSGLRNFWGGLFLLLPASFPALRYQEFANSKWRKLMSLGMLMALGIVFVPAGLWVVATQFRFAAPLVNERLASYEIGVAAFMMALFYWLSWKDQAVS